MTSKPRMTRLCSLPLAPANSRTITTLTTQLSRTGSHALHPGVLRQMCPNT
jgi:hypothetical protein